MKVGLITYHSAYNYGSALQAYALQNAIKDLGYECEIINYRFTGQKDFYKIVRTKYGIKTFLSDLIQFPVFAKKIIRSQKFESFFRKYMNLTNEYTLPSQLNENELNFDIYVSGSDQIWSKYSSELYHEDWECLYPYLLAFTNKKKVAYASSLGSMQEEDIEKIKKYLLKYSHIAMRETSMAEYLSKYVNKPVEKVLDPTLLYNKNDYINLFSLNNRTPDNEKYIFYYTLRGPKFVYTQRKAIIKFAKQNGLKIYAITPYCYFPDNKYYLNKISAGVVDFLNLILNAKLVVTDSFHGTAFSLIFNKEFYSVCRGWDTDYRKNDLLRELNLMNRSITDLSACNLNDLIDYSPVNSKLDELRMHSKKYLYDSLIN